MRNLTFSQQCCSRYKYSKVRRWVLFFLSSCLLIKFLSPLKNDWTTQRLVQNRPRCCGYMWDQVLIEDNLKKKVVTYYRFKCLLFAPQPPPPLWFMQLGCGISRTSDVVVMYKAINLPSEIRYWYLFHTKYYGYTDTRLLYERKF